MFLLWLAARKVPVPQRLPVPSAGKGAGLLGHPSQLRPTFQPVGEKILNRQQGGKKKEKSALELVTRGNFIFHSLVGKGGDTL